jgi:hypothetical protein
LGLQPKKWFKSINIAGTNPFSVEIMETEPEYWQAVAAAATSVVVVVVLVVLSYESTVSSNLMLHKIHY